MNLEAFLMIALVLLLAVLLLVIFTKAAGRNTPDPTAEENLPIRHRARKQAPRMFRGKATGAVKK